MPGTYSSNWLDAQTSATRALLKFCTDHNRTDGEYVDSIRSCLSALKQRDISTALSHYQSVPLGGMMCFNDWWPPCIIEYETPEYVATVFEALTSHWSRLMRLSLPPKQCRACGKEIPALEVCPLCYMHRGT